MSNARTGTTPAVTYRAETGTHSFDIRVERGHVTIDGEPADVRFERAASGQFTLLLDGRSISGTLRRGPGGTLIVTTGGRDVEVRLKDEQDLLLEKFGVGAGGGAAHREVHAPMPGLVVRVSVSPGQAVKAGEGLLVLEAMKMENELRAPGDGVIAAVQVKPGDAVGKGDLLVVFEN